MKSADLKQRNSTSIDFHRAQYEDVGHVPVPESFQLCQDDTAQCVAEPFRLLGKALNFTRCTDPVTNAHSQLLAAPVVGSDGTPKVNGKRSKL
eukprot:Clim_evm6s58 gene=Clim_evmTU6s58